MRVMCAGVSVEVVDVWMYSPTLKKSCRHIFG